MALESSKEPAPIGVLHFYHLSQTYLAQLTKPTRTKCSINVVAPILRTIIEIAGFTRK